jgi:hypothetical protein
VASSAGLACGSMTAKRRKSMEEEDEAAAARKMRYGVTLLKMMSCWRSFYVPERRENGFTLAKELMQHLVHCTAY